MCPGLGFQVFGVWVLGFGFQAPRVQGICAPIEESTVLIPQIRRSIAHRCRRPRQRSTSSTVRARSSSSSSRRYGWARAGGTATLLTGTYRSPTFHSGSTRSRNYGVVRQYDLVPIYNHGEIRGTNVLIKSVRTLAGVCDEWFCNGVTQEKCCRQCDYSNVAIFGVPFFSSKS